MNSRRLGKTVTRAGSRGVRRGASAAQEQRGVVEGRRDAMQDLKREAGRAACVAPVNPVTTAAWKAWRCVIAFNPSDTMPG